MITGIVEPSFFSRRCRFQISAGVSVWDRHPLARKALGVATAELIDAGRIPDSAFDTQERRLLGGRNAPAGCFTSRDERRDAGCSVADDRHSTLGRGSSLVSC